MDNEAIEEQQSVPTGPLDGACVARDLVFGEPFLLLHIFSFLPTCDLGRATLVCRHFYAVGAQDGDHLWRNLLAQDRKLEDWRDVRSRETARAYVVNNHLFAKAWHDGDLQVVTLSGHKMCKLESCGPFLIGFKMVERTSPEIIVWDFFREHPEPLPAGRPGGSRLRFVWSPVPLHIIPSLNPPVHLRVERPSGNDADAEVQHLVLATFHTNLYHSLRNDWPTVPIALSRSREAYRAREGSDDSDHERIVAPHPLETNKVVLNNCHFTEFPSELLDTLPRVSRWTSTPVLHHIDLRFNKISSIPDTIFMRLSNIRVLILSNNAFTTYPNSIIHLKDTLEFLDVGDNGISVIPSSIAALTNLTFLRLSKNPINDCPLPDELGLLTKLQNLRMYKTGISQVPSCVTRLVNLMELDFGECNLRELPDGITRLTRLRILRLDNNKLNRLPEGLFDAVDLVELTSADNLGISTAGVETKMLEATQRRERQRTVEEVRGTFDYEDESNYYQGVRVYDLVSGAILRTFGRRGDYLYHLTRQLSHYTPPSSSSLSSSSSSAPALRQLNFAGGSGIGAGRPRPAAIIGTTGSLEGGATFWDVLKGRALHKFPAPAYLSHSSSSSLGAGAGDPFASEADAADAVLLSEVEPPLLLSQQQPKIPPLILTFTIDELLILHDQSSFSVYDLSTGTMLHDSVRVVESGMADAESVPSPDGVQVIKHMGPLDGLIFVHLKNPTRFLLYDPRTAKLAVRLSADCPARYWIPIKNKRVPKGCVVVRSRSAVEMWDLFDSEAGGRKLLAYEGHRDTVFTLVQSGDLLFSGGSDGVRVWDLHTGQCLRSLLELIPHHVVDMCVMNHTLFVVDSTGYLRAYVPSHLMWSGVRRDDGEENGLVPAATTTDEEDEAAEAAAMLRECVWDRHQREDPHKSSPSKSSLGARLGVSASAEDTMITSRMEITCATCGPFLDEARKHVLPGNVPTLSLFGTAGSEVCTWCAAHCHSGHPLTYGRHAMAGAALFTFLSAAAVSARHCTCGVCGHPCRAFTQAPLLSIDSDTCSFEVVGVEQSAWQRHVYCQTCGNFDANNDAICMACARRCHSGHVLRPAEPDNVTCQCGVKHHKCRSRAEMEQRQTAKRAFRDQLLRVGAQVLIHGRMPQWTLQEFGMSPSAGSVAEQETQLQNKVARAFARFFDSGSLDPDVFDRLSELVEEESHGTVLMRRPCEAELADLAGGFGENTYYALLYSLSARPFPREGRGFLIMADAPHLYFF